MQMRIALCVLAVCVATVIARRHGSSESQSSESADSSKKGGHGRRPPCKVDSEELDVCAVGGTCTFGPVKATNKGASVEVYFCEKPASVESTEEESTSAPASVNMDKLAGALLCNACEVTNGNGVFNPTTCVAPSTCTEGPVKTDIGGNTQTAMFCSVAAPETFSLIKAIQCTGKGQSAEESDESSKKSGKKEKKEKKRKGGKKPRRE